VRKCCSLALSEPVIAIFGPTAVGKTEVAVEVAEILRRGGERPVAVSADAIAVYEGLDLLAAKPSPRELERLEHRLISVVPVEREFSVAEFAERAHGEIDMLAAEGSRPIVVGGTGLYLRAALTELDLKPPPRPGLRAELERELAELGPARLHERLAPRSAAAVHPNDRKRIVRALELELMGEEPYRESRQLWSERLRRPARLFGVVMGPDALAQRVRERAHRMLEGDVLAEVETALERGASRTARKAMGFEEIAAHLAGEIDLGEARALLERRHLAYAKRQLTWMRKLAGVETVDRTELDVRQTAEELVERLDSLPRTNGPEVREVAGARKRLHNRRA
jgi:tRNA dimethylallyltransferase